MEERIQELIKAAKGVQGHYILAEKGYDAGGVGAALMTKSGHIYTGICIDLACGIGFCAEHAAIAEMLKHRETAIQMIVAVGRKGIMPPCGRCREMMLQISKENKETIVVLSEEKSVKLKELMPFYWND